MTALASARVAAVRSAADAVAADVIETTARLAAIGAPTGDEYRRSTVVAELFVAAECASPWQDALGNVVARLPGGGGGPALLLAAHLDTVFPAGTDTAVRRDPFRLHGAGVGDNSLGVAAVLAMPALLRLAGETPAVDVLLTGNVGEEGLGNLIGMRAVMDAFPEIGAAIAIEGHNLGRVTTVAVGSRRLKISVTAPGGHSWGDHGRPSAIHAAARLIADLDAILLPETPKTSLNVGLIEGGMSVNTIAPSASFVLDLRSVDPDALKDVAERVERAVAWANRNEISVTATLLGERPAGRVSADSPLVGVARDALEAVGVGITFDASSTDANVPIARGVPAICVGLTEGGNVHREDEYIETGPIRDGLAQLALVALGAADALAAGRLTTRRD